jgi:CBS domain-containing protein
MTLAGAFTGVCALAAPEVMGLGYDTVQLAMIGGIGLLTLVLIALLKLLATIACGGLGLPGGMIGPMVVIGATAGGALGIVGDALVPATGAAPAFYAMLGVAAMMGASLHAPLAALTAILELTANPNTLLPGMAAVIGAFLMSRVVVRQEPLFVSILQARGIEFRFDPVALALERTGVAAVMSRDFVVIDAQSPAADAARASTDPDAAAVLVRGDEIVAVREGERFAAAIAAAPNDADALTALGEGSPGFVTVPLHATLGEALGVLDAAGADVAIVCTATVPRRGQLHGVISRRQIDRRVRYRTPRHPA